MAIQTPILFVIFNRPDRTAKVWEEIRQAKPQKLFIAADGPRANRSGEKELCEQARRITEQIDWDCEVLRDFSDTNLGVINRVHSAIDWIFNASETAIIIEDDCLPNQSFFTFCETMLEKYKNNTHIMMISGINVAGEWKKDKQDYLFSYYGGVWGWASWRRAWMLYDSEMSSWKDKKVRTDIKNTLGDNKQYWARRALFDVGFIKKSWEYQWAFTRLIHHGLSVVPAVNLITNIGFGADATHTKDSLPILEKLIRYDLSFPLRDCQNISADTEYDKIFFLSLHPEFNHSWPVIVIVKIWQRLISLLKTK